MISRSKTYFHHFRNLVVAGYQATLLSHSVHLRSICSLLVDHRTDMVVVAVSQSTLVEVWHILHTKKHQINIFKHILYDDISKLELSLNAIHTPPMSLTEDDLEGG
jgi:hypothetical protein